MNNPQTPDAFDTLDPGAALDWETGTPFLFVAGGWFLVAEGVSWHFAGGPLAVAMGWAGLLWALCLFDLYALFRAVGAAFEIVSSEGKKQRAVIVQAFYWGVIKLTCLGILGAILFNKRSLPLVSELTGFGTIVIVPLLGGYGWSQKVLRHA